MLEPKVAKALMADIPELVQFRAHLLEETLKLNQLDSLQQVAPPDMAIEVLARLRALDVIKRILAPVINIQDGLVGINSSEYVA